MSIRGRSFSPATPSSQDLPRRASLCPRSSRSIALAVFTCWVFGLWFVQADPGAKHSFTQPARCSAAPAETRWSRSTPATTELVECLGSAKEKKKESISPVLRRNRSKEGKEGVIIYRFWDSSNPGGRSASPFRSANEAFALYRSLPRSLSLFLFFSCPWNRCRGRDWSRWIGCRPT